MDEPPDEADAILATGARLTPHPRGPAPFDGADLRRALHLVYPADEADDIADALCPADGFSDRTIWVGDTVLLVALLSADHHERIRAWLGLDPATMDREMSRVRSEWVG